jgi:2-dehydro-3-deoxyphosphogluconate aldolase / (4S)-4-hydroxy-2-oxoglutarate aldolase
VSEEAVVAALEQARVLPVVALEDASIAGELCVALLAGGISCVEITFRTSAAAAAIERAAAVDGMLVGAGTVLTVEQAQAAARSGARFAVAPGTDDEVAAAMAGLAEVERLVAGHAPRVDR